MKTAVILLSLAALGLATPRPNFGVTVVARQEDCIYDVLCRSNVPEQDIDPDTTKCCLQVGGVTDEAGSV